MFTHEVCRILHFFSLEKMGSKTVKVFSALQKFILTYTTTTFIKISLNLQKIGHASKKKKKDTDGEIKSGNTF